MIQTSTVLDFKRGRWFYGDLPPQMGTGETGSWGRQGCVYWEVEASRAERNEALHFITKWNWVKSNLWFTGKDTEAQRGQITCLRSHSMLIIELESQSCHPSNWERHKFSTSSIPTYRRAHGCAYLVHVARHMALASIISGHWTASSNQAANCFTGSREVRWVSSNAWEGRVLFHITNT